MIALSATKCQLVPMAPAEPSSAADPPVPLVDRVVALARALHARGLDVAVSDTIDAVTALGHLDLGDVDVARRTELRECLRVTLVKQADPRRHFDELFDRWFPAATRAPGTAIGTVATGSEEERVDALVDGDLGGLAAALVDAHGGFDSGEVRTEKHHVQRVLRAADLARLMMLALRDRDGIEPAAMRARVDDLKRLIAAEVAERVGPAEDEPAVSEVDRIDFLHATRTELAQMREAVRPLARRVATRLARRRQRARGGRVDIRRTMRRSLAAGGVPLDLAERRRRPHRPELFVLCDVSGSVAEFSVFTLTLMAALSAELPHTRAFIFVDAVDEVTGLLEQTSHQIEPWQLLRNTNVIGETGHSDYGAVFEQFLAQAGSDLSPRSTVLITGDGRSNYRPSRAAALGEIARTARSVFWLDPEPRDEWDQHDSAIPDYRDHCTAVFEVRTLAQLEAAIERIL